MINIEVDFRNKTILIVEDSEACYLLLKEILRKTGVNIIHACDGREALNLCIENINITLVLMNIRMPEMDGMEATRSIKAIRKDLPIIIVTATVSAEVKLKSKDAGCDGFIEKPVPAKILLSTLAKWL